MPDFPRYPTALHALGAALGFYDYTRVADLARLLGVAPGIPLLALLGRPERSPKTLWAATSDHAGSLDIEEVGQAWIEGHRARQALVGTLAATDRTAALPRPPRPALPALPLVLAPMPAWLDWHTPPDGSVVPPDAAIEVRFREVHPYRLTLDGVQIHRSPLYFVYTDPPSGRILYHPPAALAPGAHTLTARYEVPAYILTGQFEAPGAPSDIYSWVFTVRDEQAE